MYRFILFVALFASASLFAQDEEPDYAMFQTIYLKADNAKIVDLFNAVKKHNDTFHKKAGPEQVNVWNVMTGERAGGMIWAKGPLTWKSLDSPHPMEEEGHLLDWIQNVVSLSAVPSDMSFFRTTNDLFYAAENLNQNVMRVTYFKVEENKTNNVVELIKTVLAVFEENKFGSSFGLLFNAANDGGGKDIALINIYKDFAALEGARLFPKAYDAKHGANAWQEFVERWQEATNLTTSEIRQLVPELSFAGN